jgi:hypothetical protein
LKEYLDYNFEEKEGSVTGSRKELEHVLAIDKATAELSWPQIMENCQTTEFCWELSVGVATTLLTELNNPKKATHNYIHEGLLAFSNLSQTEKDASMGNRENNDPSEGNFETFTDVLCNGARISIDSAAGIGQARYNKDLNHNHALFVTGRKARARVSRQKWDPSIPCQKSYKILYLLLQRETA